MIILNFTHPLTPDQVKHIEAPIGEPVAEMVNWWG